MGLLLEGDANNSNNVDAVDFSILKGTFGKSVGQPGYDGRADFNGDQVVNVPFRMVKSTALTTLLAGSMVARTSLPLLKSPKKKWPWYWGGKPVES